MKILVVEDEAKIAAFISGALREEHYHVDVVHNGEEALTRAQIHSYNLILLDIMLPQQDGLTVCRKLRESDVSSLIMLLTARSGLRDKVHGFDTGADDYLTKPFDIEELLARVRALLRRQGSQGSNELKIGDLILNQATQEVRRAGRTIELTSREFALLRYLMLHPNEVITRTMITEHVWGEDSAAFTNVIDVYINYIRKKIDKDFDPPLIHTVRRVGYILKDPGRS